MYIVAIARLNGELQRPALAALAAEVETTPYELKLTLNAGFPAVVLVTSEQATAGRVATAIARQGHVPVLCDRSQIVPSSRMTTLRNFELSRTQLIDDAPSGQSLQFVDLSVLVRAVHRSTQHSFEQVQERKLRPVMAVVSGGLVMSKKVTKDITTTTSAREQVLYLFRHGAQPPWILRERVANYAALGQEMGPSSFDNFGKTVARLRQLAPSAAYDERLVSSRPIRGIGDGSDAVDILAYVLAQSLAC